MKVLIFILLFLSASVYSQTDSIISSPIIFPDTTIIFSDIGANLDTSVSLIDTAYGIAIIIDCWDKPMASLQRVKIITNYLIVRGCYYSDPVDPEVYIWKRKRWLKLQDVDRMLIFKRKTK